MESERSIDEESCMESGPRLNCTELDWWAWLCRWRCCVCGRSIGTGTDSAGVVSEEIEILASLGMKPMDCIEAATRVAARALGLEDQIGTLEEGKLADIVVLKGNPLEDIGAYSRASIVIRNGHVFEGNYISD